MNNYGYVDVDKLTDYANNTTIGLTANDIMRFPKAEVQPVKKESARRSSKNGGVEMTKRKHLPCQYCATAFNGYGKEMNNSGDEFKLYHETGKKWRLVSLSRSVFILKVKYCPMCGRRLKKGDAE